MKKSNKGKEIIKYKPKSKTESENEITTDNESIQENINTENNNLISITSNLKDNLDMNKPVNEIPVIVDNHVYTVTILLDNRNRPWFVAGDIATILDYKYTKNVTALVRDYQKLELREFKEKFETDERKYSIDLDVKTIIINEEGLKEIIFRNRKCSREKTVELCEIFNIEYKDNYKIITKEQRDIGSIVEAFKGENMITQYSVGKYRIDLYFLEYKIVIECDEFDHSRYSIEDEQKRSDYIKENLGCTFVRFNPDAEDFSINRVINNIYLIIKGYNKRVIEEKNEKNKKLEKEIKCLKKYIYSKKIEE